MASGFSSRFWRACTLAMGTTAVGGGAYFAFRKNSSLSGGGSGGSSIPTEKERMATFNKLSKVYDRSWQFDELCLRMGKYRKRLINEAQGRVLEVAAGTGSNLEYYMNSINSNSNKINPIDEIYFVDKSPEMIDELKLKTSQMNINNNNNNNNNNKNSKSARFRCSVNDSENLQYKNDEFDCVIDTFGLCSYEHPKVALNEMIRVCKPGQKLLLLEHGRSNWRLVELWQNRNVLSHVQDWGCYFNRDILSYIENRNDIEITKLERRHFGTTYYVEAIKLDAHGKEAAMEAARQKNGTNKDTDINVMVNVN